MDYEFKHTYKDLNGNIQSVVEVSFNAEYLGDIVDEFRDFLRGCGFGEKLILEYIPEE